MFNDCLLDVSLISLFYVLDFQIQLLDVLQGYFRHAGLYHPNAADLENSTYLSSAVRHFLNACANILSRSKPTSSVFSHHQDLLQSLASGLGSTHTGVETGTLPDYLFLSSLIYVTELLKQRSMAIITETGRELILTIFQYRLRFHPRDDIMEMMSSWIKDPSAFDRVWSDFVFYAAELLGIVLPPIAEEVTDFTPVECVDIQEEPQHTSGDAVIDFGRIGDQVARDTASTRLSQEDDDWATT